MKAAIYCRISRVRDRQHGKLSTLGVDRQEPPCRQLADWMGWEIAEVYTDNDLSAYSGKRRPAYEQMLDDARGGAIQAIVAWDADRLTRRPIENEHLIELAEKHGIQLATVTGEYDLCTPSGRLHFRIKGAIARHESEHRSERLRLKHEELARNGKVANGGPRPFGFEQNRQDVRLEEAELIREAARRLLAGEGTIAIITDWNARGIKTSQDVKWTPTTLKRLMVNPRLAGLRTHHGEVVGPACWQAILDQTTHERLRGILMDPSRSRPGPKHRYLLTGGVARCGRCGGELSSNRCRDKPSYWCASAAQYGGCGRIRIDGAFLEGQVRDQLLAALSGPALAAALSAAAGADERAGHLTGQVAADEAALEELARDFYSERLISRAEFLTARKTLEERIEDTRRALSRIPTVGTLADLPSDEQALHTVWDEHAQDVAWRRCLVGLIIDRVNVRPAKVRGSKSLDPDRIEIIWRG